MMYTLRLEIYSQREFDNALASGAFNTATVVRLDNLPLVSAVPELPAATDVWLDNLPLVKRKPLIALRGLIYLNGCVWR